MIKKLDFYPLPGLKSPHLQMILANVYPCGEEPPYQEEIVVLKDGDKTLLAISEPPNYSPGKPVVTLIHGLGGSIHSPYLVRLTRKFYNLGYKVVRVNLRGDGASIATNLPYHSGISLDVKEIVDHLAKDGSEVVLIGFSMSGNIVLKMAGEWRNIPNLSKIIAVCPLIDLNDTSERFKNPKFLLYQQSYLRSYKKYGWKWAQDKPIKTHYDFDKLVTAPLWGFSSPEEYYSSCSSLRFIPGVKMKTQILFAADDPFVNYKQMEDIAIPPCVEVFVTTYGSHMGFLGKTLTPHDYFWMDETIINWVKNLD